MNQITVIILTRDEARHITRAITSVRGFASDIVVVDSGSKDQTVALARKAGARVLLHPWTSHSAQFNWALGQLSPRAEWVFRLDADEVATPELVNKIMQELPAVDGIYVRRLIRFQRTMVRFGGVGALLTMRLFRVGRGQAEDRWMDEHIVVAGQTQRWSEAIIDDNLNPLDWWVTKHNRYASLEVADILSRKYGGDTGDAEAMSAKRWVKLHVFQRLPAGYRAGLYFLYRYVVRLGFLDRGPARTFHVLQGFWYRYLVDAKLAESERRITAGTPPEVEISQILKVETPAADSAA